MATFRLHYSLQMEKAAPTSAAATALAVEYAKKLHGLTPKDVLRGLDRATNGKWMPNPFEFSEACKATTADLKMPGEQEAFDQFMRMWNRSSNYRKWDKVHPAVYWCYRQETSFTWNHFKNDEHEKRFRRLYRKAIQQARDGLVFNGPTAQIEQATKQSKADRSKAQKKNGADFLRSLSDSLEQQV